MKMILMSLASFIARKRVRVSQSTDEKTSAREHSNINQDPE